MGMEATAEELLELHRALDLDVSGALDLAEIKVVVANVHAIKERQKLREKNLSKAVLQKEQESKATQATIGKASEPD